MIVIRYIKTTFLATRRPTWPAGDAAGAAPHLARFSCAFCVVIRADLHTCQRRT